MIFFMGIFHICIRDIFVLVDIYITTAALTKVSKIKKKKNTVNYCLLKSETQVIWLKF